MRIHPSDLEAYNENIPPDREKEVEARKGRVITDIEKKYDKNIETSATAEKIAEKVKNWQSEKERKVVSIDLLKVDEKSISLGFKAASRVPKGRVKWIAAAIFSLGFALLFEKVRDGIEGYEKIKTSADLLDNEKSASENKTVVQPQQDASLSSGLQNQYNRNRYYRYKSAI